MAEIQKIRVLHDLQQHYNVPDLELQNLSAQLNDEDRTNLDRFFNGFKVEDWFKAIFSGLPWSRLIHGCEQQQFPVRSKEQFQVPDFVAIIESSSLTRKPLLVEVKRVTKCKETLRLGAAHMRLSQEYASSLGFPLVYAVYWDKTGTWTINTPDTFVRGKSSCKLSWLRAFEFDCSLVFGDKSFLVSQPIERTLVFQTSPCDGALAHNPRFGYLLTETVSTNGQRIELKGHESAAMDSVFSKNKIQLSKSGDTTTIVQTIDEICTVKLCAWALRYLEVFKLAPDEKDANVACHVVVDLAKRLGIPDFDVFPWDRSSEIIGLQKLFFA
jgi:hypothetical protein